MERHVHENRAKSFRSGPASVTNRPSVRRHRIRKALKKAGTLLSLSLPSWTQNSLDTEPCARTTTISILEIIRGTKIDVLGPKTTLR